MSFGERITTLRKKSGITQEQLAERIGVSRQTISKWELDQSTPDLNYIGQLSEMYEVSTDYLIKGVNSNEIENATTNDDEDTNINDKKGGVGVTVVGVLLIVFGVYIFLDDEWLEGLWVACVGVELVLVRKHPVMGMISAFLSVLCMFLFMFATTKVYLNTDSGMLVKHYDFHFGTSAIMQVVSVMVVSIQGLIIGFEKNNLYNIVLLAGEILALIYIIVECRVVILDLVWSMCFIGISAFLTLNYYIHNKGERI